LSGHEQPRNTKRDKETDTVSAKYIPARAWVKAQMKTTDGYSICIGKVVGEHLECSPCGTVTCPHGGVALMALVWPEVLLSRLPKTLDYNNFLTV
jgi:hypothetical protein